MSILTKYRHLYWVLLLVPIYLFLFVKLGAPHIRLWDEGWFVVHAVEMMQEGSWFKTYFDGVPSLTSSKPPLQTWLQIGAMNLFGINELAVRLPSALAAAYTVILSFFFVRKVASERIAWLSSMVLLTSIGFIGYHTARGAEADALLTLFLILQAGSFFLYTTTRSVKWIWLTGLFVVLGFWAKSVATFLLLPGMVLYMVIQERRLLSELLTSGHFYGAVLLTIGGVLLYVFLRESAQPGYLSMFFKSNVGRYTKSVGHDQSPIYYVRNFLQGRYAFWIGFAFIGIIWSFIEGDRVPNIVRFASVLGVAYLVVITISKSKLPWYDMPFYPLAALPAAFTIERMLTSQRGIRYGMLVVGLFLLPTYHMFAHTQANRLTIQEMDFEAQEIYVSKAIKSNKELDQVHVVHEHFHGSLLFYKHVLYAEGKTLLLTNDIESIKVGMKVLLSSNQMMQSLDKKYELDTLDQYRNAVLFQVKQQHNQPNNKESITEV